MNTRPWLKSSSTFHAAFTIFHFTFYVTLVYWLNSISNSYNLVIIINIVVGYSVSVVKRLFVQKIWRTIDELNNYEFFLSWYINLWWICNDNGIFCGVQFCIRWSEHYKLYHGEILNTVLLDFGCCEKLTIHDF